MNSTKTDTVVCRATVLLRVRAFVMDGTTLLVAGPVWQLVILYYVNTRNTNRSESYPIYFFRSSNVLSFVNDELRTNS